MILFARSEWIRIEFLSLELIFFPEIKVNTPLGNITFFEVLFVPTTETTFLYSSGKESSVTPCLIETALASSSLETKSYSNTELLKYWFSNSEPSFFLYYNRTQTHFI